ncbi:hypothetical protein EK21DRAFT_86498 [Setomelanomma holmii]|uniref:MARVEL domain-containing protein n=1 Tax=Setomelanomma holmii TaxID=210430 RepID=A0A9P4HEI2_9PLEO|nr:hypothetical protein EK21DRAFT_86498 [Setomelanomma holmii]
MAQHDTHANTDYGAPAVRSNKMHRPLIMANHALHFVSSLIVMSIAAYFIHNFPHNTHLVYWVSIAAIDTILYIPALFLPVIKSYKGYLAPLAWIFSYLWLTAFIFAAQDYEYGSCAVNSPFGHTGCGLKRTLEAFAFIAFFTNLVGTVLEARLWDVQRFKGARGNNNVLVEDKHHGNVPVAGTTTAGAHHGASAV